MPSLTTDSINTSFALLGLLAGAALFATVTVGRRLARSRPPRGRDVPARLTAAHAASGSDSSAGGSRESRVRVDVVRDAAPEGRRAEPYRGFAGRTGATSARRRFLDCGHHDVAAHGQAGGEAAGLTRFSAAERGSTAGMPNKDPNPNKIDRQHSDDSPPPPDHGERMSPDDDADAVALGHEKAEAERRAGA